MVQQGFHEKISAHHLLFFYFVAHNLPDFYTNLMIRSNASLDKSPNISELESNLKWATKGCETFAMQEKNKERLAQAQYISHFISD